MKSQIIKSLRIVILGSALVVGFFSMNAQNSMPAPGSGGSFNPGPPNGIGWNPGPNPGFGGGPGGWGSPWNPGWNNPTAVVINPTVTVGNTFNQGTTKVIACGYDAQGVWRVIPLLVNYQYNGVQYNVDVLNAWNPWTDSWDTGVDVNAFNTNYILRGITYNYYVVLSYGTFYFNL